MSRGATLVVAACLALAGCTGGGGDAKKAEPSLPLPATAPTAAGAAAPPDMVPKVLLASTDKLEESIGKLDTVQVQREAGAFVSGHTVVGYSVDDISGYDLQSGKKLWTSSLDLKGGTVCFVSQPDRAVKKFTVVYGESGFCYGVASLRVSNGKTVANSDMVTLDFNGEPGGGSIDYLFTVKGVDHLVDFHGDVWRMTKGVPQPLTKLSADAYFYLLPTPQGSLVVGSRLHGGCTIDAYRLPSFKLAWSAKNSTLFPDVNEKCVTSVVKGNGLWLVQETGEDYYVVQLDPKTGKVIGKASAKKDNRGVKKGTFDLSYAALQIGDTLGLPDGDVVFPQVRGLARYSLADKKMSWSLDLEGLAMESADQYAVTTIHPSGLTADGKYIVATVSNNTAVELIAVDAKTGKLVARWAVPKKYRNGFQVKPGLTLFDGGVVLTRNFEAWEYAFADFFKDVKVPKGDLFDIGIFTFPAPKKAEKK